MRSMRIIIPAIAIPKLPENNTTSIAGAKSFGLAMEKFLRRQANAARIMKATNSDPNRALRKTKNNIDEIPMPTPGATAQAKRRDRCDGNRMVLTNHPKQVEMKKAPAKIAKVVKVMAVFFCERGKRRCE